MITPYKMPSKRVFGLAMEPKIAVNLLIVLPLVAVLCTLLSTYGTMWLNMHFAENAFWHDKTFSFMLREPICKLGGSRSDFKAFHGIFLSLGASLVVLLSLLKTSLMEQLNPTQSDTNTNIMLWYIAASIGIVVMAWAPMDTWACTHLIASYIVCCVSLSSYPWSNARNEWSHSLIDSLYHLYVFVASICLSIQAGAGYMMAQWKDQREWMRYLNLEQSHRGPVIQWEVSKSKVFKLLPILSAVGFVLHFMFVGINKMEWGEKHCVLEWMGFACLVIGFTGFLNQGLFIRAYEMQKCYGEMDDHRPSWEFNAGDLTGEYRPSSDSNILP